MSQRKSRLARKAARIARTTIEHDLDGLLGDLRGRRDDALAKINEEFRQTVKRLEGDRQASRKSVWDSYDAEREAHIKKHARLEEKAAA